MFCMQTLYVTSKLHIIILQIVTHHWAISDHTGDCSWETVDCHKQFQVAVVCSNDFSNLFVLSINISITWTLAEMYILYANSICY